MPKKVQLKLLSPSGELLNVVTCHGGQVTVFRANTSSDLRPYQRALAGTPGKERLSVSIDGHEYQPDEHNLIGLGEAPPHAGMSIGQYCEVNRISNENSLALLNSFGIARDLKTPCSQLSPDEERRLRIVVATCTPEKVLILNEPFENISSQWREQFAQLLTSFARQRGGLVIVPALSYRPDNWIDNDSIARTQVGETIQRTIGFGSAQSKSNDLMNQIRDAVRSEMNEGAPEPQRTQSATSAITGTAMSGAAFAAVTSNAADLTAPVTANLTGPISKIEIIKQKIEALGGLPALKTPLILSVVGITCAAVSLGILSSRAGHRPKDSQPETTSQTDTTQAEVLGKKEEVPNVSRTQNKPQSPDVPSSGAVNEPPKPDNILDGYPESIRISLLETSKGSLNLPLTSDEAETRTTQNPSPNAKQGGQGNLFKLLESASSTPEDKNGGGGVDPSQQDQASSWQAPPNDAPVEEVDPSEEQQRREAIRQKFLDAIRAAAEKRQAAMDDSGT